MSSPGHLSPHFRHLGLSPVGPVFVSPQLWKYKKARFEDSELSSFNYVIFTKLYSGLVEYSTLLQLTIIKNWDEHSRLLITACVSTCVYSNISLKVQFTFNVGYCLPTAGTISYTYKVFDKTTDNKMYQVTIVNHAMSS